MDKESLIDVVIEQIEIDIKNKDLTAIYELLEHISDHILVGFLPEHLQQAFNITLTD